MAYTLNALSGATATEIGLCDATNPLSKSSQLCIRNGKLYCNGEQVGTFNTWSAVSGTPIYAYLIPTYAYGIANGRLFQLSISNNDRITVTQISEEVDWVDVTGVSYDAYVGGTTEIEGSYNTCVAFGIRTGGKLYSLLGSSVRRMYLSNLTTAAAGFTCISGGHVTKTTVTRVEVEGSDSSDSSDSGDGWEQSQEYTWEITLADFRISFGISDGKLYGLVNTGGVSGSQPNVIAVQVGSMSTWTAVAGGYVNAEGGVNDNSVFGIAGGCLYRITGTETTSGWTFTATQEGSLSTWTSVSKEQSVSYPIGEDLSPILGIAGGCLYRVSKDDFTQIGTLDTWTAVAGNGEQDTCVAYGLADGSLYAIGATDVTRIGTFSDWLRIGAYYAIRGRSDSDGSNGGTLWVQGKNANYELGLGHNDTPVKTLSKSGNALDDWVSGAFCRAAMILINKSGEMWGVGNNMDYHLGQTSNNEDITGFIRIGSASNWVKVCGDSGATFALNSSGQLWYWTTSTGADGELASEEEYIDFQTGYSGKGLAVKADGTLQYINNGVYPVSFTDMAIEDGATNFVKCATIGLATSSPTLMALTADGKIYTATSWSGTFVKLESDQVWMEIACGCSSFYAINTSGELYAWSTGDGLGNKYGQLGLGDTEEHTTPEKVGEASNWVFVQGGSYKVHVINADGKLYSAGGSVSYGLGLNSTATQATLRQVPLDNCALCTIQGTGWNSDSFGVIILDSVPPSADGGTSPGSVSGFRLGSSIPVKGQKGLLINGQYFLPLIESAEAAGTGLLLNGFWLGNSIPVKGQKGLLINGQYFMPFATPPASILNDDTVKFLLCPSMSGGKITDIASAGNSIALTNTGGVTVAGNTAILFGEGKKLTIPADTLPSDVFINGSSFLIEFQCLIPTDTEKNSCAFARDSGTSVSARLDMYLNTVSGDASYGDISIGYWTNSVTRPQNFTSGSSHVIGFEYDGDNTSRVYLDGVMQYSFTGTSYLPFRTLEFHIGNDNDGIGTTSENPFYGNMSYFRIRNVAPYKGASYTPEMI